MRPSGLTMSARAQRAYHLLARESAGGVLAEELLEKGIVHEGREIVLHLHAALSVDVDHGGRDFFYHRRIRQRHLQRAGRHFLYLFRQAEPATASKAISNAVRFIMLHPVNKKAAPEAAFLHVFCA